MWWKRTRIRQIRQYPYVSTFASTEMKLTLKKDGAAYSGSINYRGTDYPANAHTAGDGLAGTGSADRPTADEHRMVQLQLEPNSNGSPIITTVGKEYMVCR